MDITSLQPAVSSPAAPSQASPVSAQEAAQRRQLLQAANVINESGVLGQNQLEFLLDRQTHQGGHPGSGPCDERSYLPNTSGICFAAGARLGYFGKSNSIGRRYVE